MKFYDNFRKENRQGTVLPTIEREVAVGRKVARRFLTIAQWQE